ncbi:D-serine ammonia-lyase [Carboxydothermus hydrogenoformans]|uniref:Probable D-serine dehydratase n=1 Tax=Carboxydothermus hydrogenoformans (strain ATCC BAA-161 / DSM 6008 / Z-2901) TaxID=246194 RepID=SDHD_CARHZ|nr:D-serine ammonia-lyase [Carboxydothermus hydrogenoformans]Q3AFZ5.1 RecName: Full=Probable D-serine dehydratase; AltName: Full=D-serine deaminase; Short=DSD [Carboxydothermus hydrogenoformans Z-2901]ABB15511.1 D-serine dehydratase [Carboxydothermus hydrogenoformans Z-2901]
MSDLLTGIKNYQQMFWQNPNKLSADEALARINFSFDDIFEAQKRLQRFAPLIKKLFPETENGIIESPLAEIPRMKQEIEKLYGGKIHGRLFLKCDNYLKVAGSIKARGGIYEVLKHAETLLLENGLITLEDDYSKIAEERFKKFFSNYKVAVGSTGNLGLSIGIMAAALGFKVDVHMSHDAKEWKKKILRDRGVNVIEYREDYSKAVEEGRKKAAAEKNTYFIDDENSRDLFLGYSVAALRLKDQLTELGIEVNKENPLFVYLPCGVGGAPGGISFGLKTIFKDDVYCYFVEPTHSPCMLLGLVTQKFSAIHVRDFGLDNITEADGLAVGSPSKLVAEIANILIDGIYTIEDEELFKLLALLKDSENIKVEPSAAASLKGPLLVNSRANAIHISWATGGIFIPEEIYREMYMRGKSYLKDVY